MAGRLGEPTKLFHPSAEARRAAYGSPGNVRRLQNRLERAYIVCSCSMLFSSNLFEEDGSQAAAALDTDTPVDGYMAACENAFTRAVLLQTRTTFLRPPTPLAFPGSALGEDAQACVCGRAASLNRRRRCVDRQREYAHGISR
ncbi:AAA-type ATPase lid domain-containing protein [Paraburkholderia madseniana]